MNLQKTPKTKDQEQAKPKTNQPTKKKTPQKPNLFPSQIEGNIKLGLLEHNHMVIQVLIQVN